MRNSLYVYQRVFKVISVTHLVKNLMTIIGVAVIAFLFAFFSVTRLPKARLERLKIWANMTIS